MKAEASRLYEVAVHRGPGFHTQQAKEVAGNPSFALETAVK
jgi:hypothetical protein